MNFNQRPGLSACHVSRFHRHFREPSSALARPSRFPLFLAAFLIGLFLVPSSLLRAQTADLALVKQRILATLAVSPPSAVEAEGYRASLLPDGTWADLDLSSTAQTYWPGRVFLERIRAMARVHAFDPVKHDDPALRAAIFLAYDTWIARDPRSTNWWYQSINTPQNLGEILLLMEPVVSAARLSAGLPLIARSYVSRTVNSGTNTGSNRVEQAYGSLLRGLLISDAALVVEAYLAMGDTILVNSAHASAEGVQPDGSFHQHGAQLYDGGYGYGYAQSLLKFGAWGAGTSLGFNHRQMRVLVDYLLDGPQWFVRGDTLEFTATARAISRPGGQALALGYRAMMDNALPLAAGYRSAELATFRARLEAAAATGAASPDLALTGNRQFWRSDIMVHHRPGFMIGVKTSSTRTLQPETGNGEGLQNLHLADGVTLIQRHGDEYDEIMPAWDWRHLPGTTTQDSAYSLKPAADWGVYGTSTHAGGVSDGTDGAASFAYNRLGVSVLKSWFFLGDVMLALGADLRAPTATAPVITTVEQSRRTGPVVYSNGNDAAAVIASSGSAAPPALRWVHHDGIGYFFPAPVANASLSNAVRTGTWQALNTAQSATPVSVDVFTLLLNHGAAPAGASYSYLVAPGLTAAGMPSFPLANYSILRNDTSVQAVKDLAGAKTAATFWGAGSVDGITCDAKANLLVTRSARFLDVAVCDPTQANTGNISIEIQSAVAGLLRADTGMTVLQTAPTLRLSVAASRSYGRSFTARFYLRPNAYATLTIPAAADAHAYDGAPSTNYGTSPTLTCKLITASSGWSRDAYLRFDLAALAGRTPAAAALRLSPVLAQTSGLHSVQAVAPGSWTETGLNWNNRPNPDAAPTAVWLPAIGTRVRADVLPLVLARTTSALDLAVLPFAPTFDGLVNYASRENSDTSLRPALELIIPRPELTLWREENFGASATNPAIASETADPDSDGEPNLLEFATGTDPLSPSGNTRVFEVTVQGLQLRFTRAHAALGESTLLAEWSETLAPDSWSTLGITEQILADDGIRRTVVASVPHTASGRLFVRLRVFKP